MNRLTSASIIPLLAAALIMTACASRSPSAKTTVAETQAGTRTGAVKNIMIKETVMPESLTVNAGDEVRWLNQRREPVTITFLDPIENSISCKKGFTKTMGMGTDNATTLDPNETAGLCFTRLGTARYSVTSDSSDKKMPDTMGAITVQ
jgi:plastocyanin